MKFYKASILFASAIGLISGGALFAQTANDTQRQIVSPPMVISARAPVYTLGDVFFARAGAAARAYRNNGANKAAVINLYQLAAQNGKNQAYMSLADFYSNNGDNQLALDNFKKAAELNIFGANYRTATLIHKMNPNDCGAALAFLEKAVVERSSMSEVTSADWYVNKTCGANDDKKALEYALNVTNAFSYTHINFIARAYLEGIGTPKDLPLAWAYLTIASNMAKSDTSWVKHDPQYAIDTLASLDAELKRQPSEYAKAQNELDDICKANYLCPMKLVEKRVSEGRSIARAVPYPPPAPPPPMAPNRAAAPEGYKNFEDLSSTNYNKYKELRDLYTVAVSAEREYLKTNPRTIDFDLLIGKYQNAADAGHAHAMLRLSNLYQEKRDSEKSREWLKKAADAGNGTAQLKYGQLSLNPLNCDDAKRYLGYAQYNLSIAADIELGKIYGSNICGAPDYAKAFRAHVRAARYGINQSQIELADAFYSAKGTQQNLMMAVAWGKISWYNAPSRGIFSPSDQKKAFDRAKTIEKTLLPATQVEIKNIINELCLFETTCRNISNEDLIRMQGPET